MKLILLHSKRPLDGIDSFPFWYIIKNFYIVRRSTLNRILETVIRYDEFNQIFYIIENNDDGFMYRNKEFKKL